jgi:hypothetical protein
MIQRKYICIITVFLLYNYQIFASSQRQESCVIVNKTNFELFFTVTYFDDFVGVDAMSSREVPVDENEVSLKIWGHHSPGIKKASYVLRSIPDQNGENVIFSMWERRGKEKELTHLQIFHRLVEDIVVYDSYGNVIMTIDDINENTLKSENDGLLSLIEITPDIVKEGGEKYNNLPKFNELVMNMPYSSFVIENKSATQIIVIGYTNDDPVNSLGAWSYELQAGQNNIIYRMIYNEVLDPMTLFYLRTKDMNIYDTGGSIILAFNDITEDRLVETVEGSETYGLRTFTITITDQDLIFGEEKYKNIDKINIKAELENVENIRDIFIKNGPRILEKGIDPSIFN